MESTIILAQPNKFGCGRQRGIHIAGPNKFEGGFWGNEGFMTGKRSARTPFLLLGLLTFLNVLNFVQRYLIASLAPLIKEDMGLSNTDIGLLSGLCFVTLYAIMGLVIGTLADKFSRPKIMASGLFIWSLFTAVSGGAVHF